MISITGLGSGLDVDALVTGLVAAEGDVKTQNLNDQRTDLSTEISAFGTLSSVLGLFQDSIQNLDSANDYEISTAVPSDRTVFSASTSGSVAPATYDIEVVALAEAHKLLSPEFTDADTVVGTGTLTITSGSNTFDVIIDSDNDTLSEIRDAINASSENSSVSASILNVDDGMGGVVSKLILSADESGTANEISILVDDDDLSDKDNAGLSQLFYQAGDVSNQMVEITEATDTDVRIDGQTVLSSGNTVSDAIEGISMEFYKAEPGTEYTLTVGTDTNQIRSNIETFVSTYNTYISTANALTAFNSSTQTGGILLGDATVLGVTSQIRRNLTDSVEGLTGGIQSLIDIGISTDDNGQLQINDTILSEAIDDNLDDVITLFSSETDGIAVRLDAVVDEYVKTGGILQNKTEGLTNSVEDIDERLVDLEEYLDSLETRLLAQFNAMDSLIAQLNTTSQFISQNLATLPTIGSNNN